MTFFRWIILPIFFIVISSAKWIDWLILFNVLDIYGIILLGDQIHIGIRVTAKCRDKNFVFLCIFSSKLEIYNGNCAEGKRNKNEHTNEDEKNAIQLSGKKNSSHSDINDSIAIGITLVSHGFVSFYPRYIYRMVWNGMV